MNQNNGKKMVKKKFQIKDRVKKNECEKELKRQKKSRPNVKEIKKC